MGKRRSCREPTKELFFMGICRLREVRLSNGRGVTAPTADGFFAQKAWCAMKNTTTKRIRKNEVQNVEHNPEATEEIGAIIPDLTEAERAEAEELLMLERVHNPWNYIDENRLIYSGRDVAQIIKDTEDSMEAATITDLVRAFLQLNTDSFAAVDLFAAAASIKYDVSKREKG